MRNEELDVVMVVELSAEVEPGIEKFFVGGGEGDAYQQAVVTFGFYGGELAYLGVGTGADVCIEA